MAELSTTNLGADGINITQNNIIGAIVLDPTTGSSSQITRITLDTRETKDSIRKAAESAGSWGNGSQSVFFRDITLDKRKRKTSKPEDTKTPKKTPKETTKEDTPRRGVDTKKHRTPEPKTPPKKDRVEDARKTNRPAPAKSPPRFGFETHWEERARTVEQRQKEDDAYARDLIKVKKEQAEARKAKHEHQRKEEEEAQERARRNAPTKTPSIRPFRAVNEENMHREEPPPTRTLHDSLHAMTKEQLIASYKEMINVNESEDSANEEGFGGYSDHESLEDGEAEYPAPEPDSEGPERSETEEVHGVDPVFEEEEAGYDLPPSPEREVLFTPMKPPTKNAKRNARRRILKNIRQRQQEHEENKSRAESDHKQKTGRVSALSARRLEPLTTSTELMSDSDSKAGRRSDNNNDNKRRRESQESVEEVDSLGRKLPKNKKRN